MVLIRRTQYPDADHEAETLACHKCGESLTRFGTKRGKKAKNRGLAEFDRAQTQQSIGAFHGVLLSRATVWPTIQGKGANAMNTQVTEYQAVPAGRRRA
jgi:hypothetical protein